MRSASEPASVTCGTCYRIGAAEASAVLANLDFREKGGYTRDVVDVAPSSGGEPVRALVYSATPDNPNFDADMIRDERAAAQTIGAAHGPSGSNVEYLTRLATWLEEVQETDAHVANLVAMLPAACAAGWAPKLREALRLMPQGLPSELCAQPLFLSQAVVTDGFGVDFTPAQGVPAEAALELSPLRPQITRKTFFPALLHAAAGL